MKEPGIRPAKDSSQSLLFAEEKSTDLFTSLKEQGIRPTSRITEQVKMIVFRIFRHFDYLSSILLPLYLRILVDFC